MKGPSPDKPTNTNTHHLKQVVYDYSPAIEMAAFLALMLRNFPLENNSDEEHVDYHYYTSTVPAFIVGALFSFTLLSNVMFGRRPNNDNNHNPLSHQIIQAMGYVLPSAVAGLTWVGTNAATLVIGSRAAASNHIATQAMAIFDLAERRVEINDRLYDHAMDRSPSVEGREPAINGEMRYLERVAMNTENAITHAVELAAGALYIAMNSGVVRFTLNDNNRLAVISGMYAGANVLEGLLVGITNEQLYYVERWANMPFISQFLLHTGIANTTPVIGIVTREQMIAKLAEEEAKIVQAVADKAKEIQDAANERIKQIEEAAADKIREIEDAASAFAQSAASKIREAEEAATAAANEIKEIIEAAANQIEEVKEEIEARLNKKLLEAEEKIAQLNKQLRDFVQNAEETLEKVAEELKEGGKEVVIEATKIVEKSAAEINKAATKIQSLFRGNAVRKNITDKTKKAEEKEDNLVEDDNEQSVDGIIAPPSMPSLLVTTDHEAPMPIVVRHEAVLPPAHNVHHYGGLGIRDGLNNLFHHNQVHNNQGSNNTHADVNNHLEHHNGALPVVGMTVHHDACNGHL